MNRIFALILPLLLISFSQKNANADISRFKNVMVSYFSEGKNLGGQLEMISKRLKKDIVLQGISFKELDLNTGMINYDHVDLVTVLKRLAKELSANVYLKNNQLIFSRQFTHTLQPSESM